MGSHTRINAHRHFSTSKKKPEQVLASHGKTIKFMLVNSGIAKEQNGDKAYEQHTINCQKVALDFCCVTLPKQHFIPQASNHMVEVKYHCGNHESNNVFWILQKSNLPVKGRTIAKHFLNLSLHTLANIQLLVV